MDYKKIFTKIKDGYDLILSFESNIKDLNVLIYTDLECNIMRCTIDMNKKCINRYIFKHFKDLILRFPILKDEKDIEIFFAYLSERNKFTELTNDVDNHCNINPLRN